MEHFCVLISPGPTKGPSSSEILFRSFLSRLNKQHFDTGVFQSYLCSRSANDVDEAKWERFVIDSDHHGLQVTNDESVEHPVDQITEAVGLHKLLDQLPVDGSYLLEIFVDGEMCNFQCDDQEQVNLYGALLRSVMWHNGLITFVYNKDNVLFDELTDHLRLRHDIVKDGTVVTKMQTVDVWRGSIFLGLSDSLLHNSVLGFHLTAEGKCDCLFCPLSRNRLQCEKETLIVSNEMVVLQMCSIGSIPPYLLTTEKYTLSSPIERRGCDGAKKFFTLLKSNPNVCIIARLSYTSYRNTKSNLSNHFSNKTDDWKKTVLNSRMEDLGKGASPQVNFDCDIHFLLLADNSCDAFSALALRMKHPMDIHCRLFPGILSSSSESTCREEARKRGNDILRDLPHYPHKKMWPTTQTDLTFQQLQTIDPNDWPERKFLLYRSFREKENIKFPSDNEFSSLLTNELEAVDVLSLFEPSGHQKHENLTTTRIIKVKHKLKPYNSLEEVKTTAWPDVIQCHFHDVYYNANKECEVKERVCNQMKEQHIDCETQSTCDFGGAKTRGVARAACKRKRNNSGTAVRRSPRRLSSLLTKTATQPSVATILCNSVNDKREVLPLRRSPRKHATLQGTTKSSQEAKVKQKRNKTQNSMPNDLSEKHKMKLREAVVVALEKEGVAMEHALFKTCGRRLFNVCKAFAADVIGKGSTSTLMKKIAEAHVKQVIEFENLKSNKASR